MPGDQDLTARTGLKTPSRRKNKYDATVDPDADNDSDEGYEVGSEWINITADTIFKCADAGVGAAIWTTFSGHPDLASHDTLGLQRESEKSAANGYASLGADILVPMAELATGTPDGTKFVRDDGTLVTPAGGSGTPASTVEDETSFGVSTAVGTDSEYARQDHTHGSPTDPVTAHAAAGDPHTGYLQESVVSGLVTPAIVLGTAAAAGTGTTPIRHDSTIVAFDATDPVTQAHDDAAAPGSAVVAARRDHVHGMPAAGGHAQVHVLDGADHTVSGLTVGHSLQALTATTFGFAVTPAGTPATTVESETTHGLSSAVGTDTEYARQDHTHGTPAAEGSENVGGKLYLYAQFK